VYQRIVSVTTEVCYEPPDTATPELDAEPTVPDDAWRLLGEVLDEDEVDELEVASLAALAVAPEDEDDEAEAPGIVSALTAPKTPTPATAAKAMPAVMWFSRESARSRAWILASAAFVLSMVIRVRSATESSL
jgi:hypothetical protein